MTSQFRRVHLKIAAGLFGLVLVPSWSTLLFASGEPFLPVASQTGADATLFSGDEPEADPVSVQSNDEALEVDLQGVAEELGITFDEAKDQLVWQNDFNQAGGTLMVEQPDLISGAEAVRERSPRHVRITLPGTEIPLEVSQAVDPLGLDVEWILGSGASAEDLSTFTSPCTIDYRQRTWTSRLSVHHKGISSFELSRVMWPRLHPSSPLHASTVRTEIWKSCNATWQRNRRWKIHDMEAGYWVRLAVRTWRRV